MSKVLEATCDPSGIVKVGSAPISDAVILSQGKAVSSGVVIIDEEKSTYVTSNASDIQALITNIGALIDQIVLITQGLDGVTISPGSNAASIALLQTLKTQFLLTKDLLK